MRSVVLVVPGRIDTPTGGYQYDRRMAEGLERRGWSVRIREIEGSFPHPTPEALAEAARLLAGERDGTCVLTDGLAFGAMPEVVEREAPRLRLAALVHLPLGAEIDLGREMASRLAAGERRALRAAALVIVTGAAALPLLAPYGIAPDRVVVVEPGTMRAPLARGSGGASLQLLSVATLNPGKGHEILLEALAAIAATDWHLTCAGSLTRHAATVDRVRRATGRLGLEERVTLVGELDAASLDECYDRADLFVLATRQETYGMAVAEALARGLPVVSTTTGAIGDLVGDEAGLLVPPGDGEALTAALARVLGDAELRARLAGGARRVRERLRSWDEAVGEMAAALERLDVGT